MIPTSFPGLFLLKFKGKSPRKEVEMIMLRFLEVKNFSRSFLICFLNPRQRLELNSLVYIFHFVNKRAWPFSAVFCSDCLKHKGDVSMTCQTKYNIDLTVFSICNWLICDSCGDEKWKANHVNRKRQRKQQMNRLGIVIFVFAFNR